MVRNSFFQIWGDNLPPKQFLDLMGVRGMVRNIFFQMGGIIGQLGGGGGLDKGGQGGW